MAIDYEKMFSELVQRHSDLVQQRDKIEVELARLTQLLQSTYHMLSPAQQVKLNAEIDRIDTRPPGLKQGVLMALKSKGREWSTPPEIRDYLESIGVDFGTDTARGLTSVGNTLRRMPPHDLETRTMANGQIAYRLVLKAPKPPASMRKKMGL
jgi:hypothetical protein